jgi:hypothetical protein
MGRKQTYIYIGLCHEGQLEIGVQAARKRRLILVIMRCLSWQRRYMGLVEGVRHSGQVHTRCCYGGIES